jgi:hypothetical protein
MRPTDLEKHFPWYVDYADTDAIDCQCGKPCSGVGSWASHVTEEIAAKRHLRSVPAKTSGTK